MWKIKQNLKAIKIGIKTVSVLHKSCKFHSKFCVVFWHQQTGVIRYVNPGTLNACQKQSFHNIKPQPPYSTLTWCQWTAQVIWSLNQTWLWSRSRHLHLEMYQHLASVSLSTFQSPLTTWSLAIFPVLRLVPKTNFWPNYIGDIN